MFATHLPELSRRVSGNMPFGLSEMFDELRRWPAGFGPAEASAFPAVDIAENGDVLTITAELPGVAPKDVDISLEKGVLTIRGEKRFEHEEQKDDYRRIERSYGSFSRSFALPNEVDVDKAKAEFKDGVLTLNLPKAEVCKAKRIEIAS
ncbi:MAG: Hsp20/alpha crystallin family protein [Desulfovibrionaceae bacterium]